MGDSAKQRLEGAARAVRTHDWWLYKIPPLFAVACAQIVLYSMDPGTGLLLLFATVFVSLCTAAAFGYAINDWCDAAQDARVGKASPMAGLSLPARLGVVAAPVALGFAPAFLPGYGPLATMLLVLQFAVPAAYSAPPLRLKERGIAGVVADAAGAHVIPTLFILAVFAHAAGGPTRTALVFGAAAVLFQGAAGVKGILCHQDRDRDRDLEAGVRTLAASVSHEKILRVLRLYCYPLEMAGLTAMVLVLAGAAPLLALAYVVHGAMELLKLAIGWRVRLGSDNVPYLPFVNNFFPELAMPMALALSCVGVHAAYAVLPVAFVLLFRPNVANQAAETRRLFLALEERWQKVRRRTGELARAFWKRFVRRGRPGVSG
ncbi:MAG: UbiA family prenyltransferase [Desulfatibacillaceae bacterium]